jgi:hypothetical protein
MAMTTHGGGDTSAAEVSPVEIEREIERTRERMGVHLDQLGQKLSSDHLKHHAKEVISGKARRTGTRLYEFVRGHPIPVAAAGLGAVLVAVRNRRRQGTAVGLRRHASGGLTHEHPLALTLVAGVVGVALGIMAPDA